MNMKYEYGTILKFTTKAIQKHPNHCESNDRMIVVGENECIWYKNEKTVNDYKSPPVEISANTIFMFDLYRKFDSFVELANESIPKLNFDKNIYHDIYISKDDLEKYIKDFNINMVTEFNKALIQ